MGTKVRVIALYLPQYHPIPENDLWWGKGFTEWTNVGKAKPLFRGHDQPKVPADLGYYDLRLPEARIAQARLAKQYGIEGFCYWHYWFGNGKQLLQRPFEEVLKTGEPDFPFCLAWANHSWKDKQFNKGGTNRTLIEQLYPGEDDYIKHFNYLLPAFKDHRYIRVDNKPVFMVYSPSELPSAKHFIELWQKLAKDNGLKGIHFVAHTYHVGEIEKQKNLGFDGVNIVRLFDVFKKDYSLSKRIYMKTMRILFNRGRILDYGKAAECFSGEEDYQDFCYPTIIPNWDHSPRSGRSGHILIHSSAEKFRKHVAKTFDTIKGKPQDKQIVFLKSWNEWAEGNYIEPDLTHGLAYLEALKETIEKYNNTD